MANKSNETEKEAKGERSGEAPGYIIGVDFAKKGSERTAFRCPTCQTFQDLVNEDYLCKKCAEIKQENTLLGI